MRRRTAVPVLVLTLAASACGGGSGSSAAPGTRASSPSASPSPAEQPATKAAATAAANAINLTAAEVGAGYTSTPSKKDPATDKDNAAFAACVGATPPSAAVVDISSPDFSSGSGLSTRQVSSDVTVTGSTAQARTDLAAYKAGKTTACLQTFVAKTLAGAAGPDVTIAAPVITPVETPAVGTDGAFGYDVKLTAKASGISFTFDVLLQAFLVKRSEVSLTVVSIGPAFPVTERSRLLQTLLSRATAHAV